MGFFKLKSAKVAFWSELFSFTVKFTYESTDHRTAHEIKNEYHIIC
jgi:hypothetical protein